MTKLLETLSRATPAIAGLFGSDKEAHAEVTREELSALFASDFEDAERDTPDDLDQV